MRPAVQWLPGRVTRRRLSIAVLVASACGFAMLVLHDARAAAPAPPVAAEFPHEVAQHARLPCLLCHRRETNEPRPKLPGHMPCAGCHSREFALPSGPMCVICHTDTASGALEPFPRLESFNVVFDHAKHAGGRASCQTCHRRTGRGASLSIPSGIGAHTTCFECHTPRAESQGRDISSCGVCHRVGRVSRTPATSVAFSRNFSHAEHAAKGLGCAACHSVRAGARQGRQVTSPVPAQHHAPEGVRSCASCHDDKRAFGGDDFSDCKRCHEGSTWRF